MKIATGEIRLSDEDYREIAAIYDLPEFKREFGVRYSKELVAPALVLVERDSTITEEQLSESWERGRQSAFDIRSFRGINKIGYQKTVFPIRRRYESPPDVRIEPESGCPSSP